MNKAQRIIKERLEMNLAPWQIAPSEADDSTNPYPTGNLGHSSWNQARQWRDDLLKVNPDYFNEE